MKQTYEYECNKKGCGYKISDRIDDSLRDSKWVGEICINCNEGRYFRTQSSPLIKFKGEGWTEKRRN